MLRARFLRRICMVSILTCLVRALSAQATATPTFDVASVKQNKSGDARTGGQLSGARFSMLNETLVRLIGEAYATPFALPRHEIVGGPNWIDADRFDVQGVAEAPLTRERAQLMLRALLAERFRLAVHHETRELPVYNLVKVRSDGRLGEKLRRSDIDCAALRAGGATSPAAPSGPRPCVMGFGRGTLSAKAMTISQLADMGLARVVNRPVVDRTGLEGAYDWTLQWTPDQPRANQPDPGTSAQVDPDRPSIFAAIQEQLGLKLESAKGPVNVLVIDHVERPTED